MRAKGFLEIASALYETSLSRLGAEINLSLENAFGHEGETRVSFGTGCLLALERVARKEIDVSWVNPAGALEMAVRGKGPFKEPLPLRIRAMFPSWDRLVFVVSEKVGVRSLSEVREKRLPLRISISNIGSPEDSAIVFAVEEVLRAYDLSLQQIEAWGGSLQKVRRPSAMDRLAAIRDGSIDAVFDEGIVHWAPTALDCGMKFLSLDEKALWHMEDLGFQRATLSKTDYSNLKEAATTLDFSGWPVYCHEEMHDEIAYALCEAIELRRELIPADQDSPLTMAQLCNSSEVGPLSVPLHPGAESFYREKGYLR